MASEPIGRPEFDGYVLRHEHDPFAHAAMRRALEGDLMKDVDANTQALGRLRDWQQRIIGGMMFAALLLGSGAVAVVVELARGH